MAGWNVTWTLSDSTLTISGKGEMAGYKKYGDGVAPWAGDRQAIVSVVIEAGVTHVGRNAFHECNKLTNVSLPAGLKSIGVEAFASCTGLSSVEMPAGLERIEDEAFRGCGAISSITLPRGLDSIGEGVFTHCGRLSDIRVEEGNARYTVRDRALIDEVNGVLLRCFVTAKGDYRVPAGLTRIATGAFFECGGLTSVVVPEGVTSVGKEAFASCFQLKSVSLPSSLVRFEVTTFRYCRSLMDVHVAAGNLHYSSVNGVVFDAAGGKIVLFPKGRTGYYIVPKGVKKVGPLAFEGCTGLTSVTLLAGMQDVGEMAFAYCEKLSSVTCEGARPPGVESNTFTRLSTEPITLRVPAGSVDAYRSAANWEKFNSIVAFRP
jgi:hypothetical protein